MEELLTYSRDPEQPQGNMACLLELYELEVECFWVRAYCLCNKRNEMYVVHCA